MRARVRADLEALRDRHLPAMQITGRGGTDYAWRAPVARADWETACAQMAAGIDYDNFKDAVHERQGATRASAYLRIWDVMRGVQDQDPALHAGA